jgi:hypothetical protein
VPSLRIFAGVAEYLAKAIQACNIPMQLVSHDAESTNWLAIATSY